MHLSLLLPRTRSRHIGIKNKSQPPIVYHNLALDNHIPQAFQPKLVTFETCETCVKSWNVRDKSSA